MLCRYAKKMKAALCRGRQEDRKMQQLKVEEGGRELGAGELLQAVI